MPSKFMLVRSPPKKKRRRNKTLPKVSSGKQTRNIHTHTYRKIVRCVVCTQRVWSIWTPECPRVSSNRHVKNYENIDLVLAQKERTYEHFTTPQWFTYYELRDYFPPSLNLSRSFPIFIERYSSNEIWTAKMMCILATASTTKETIHNYDFVFAERDEDRYRGRCDAKFSNRQYELNYDADGNYFRSNLVVGFHFAYFFAIEKFLRHTFQPHKCETQWIRSAVHNFKMKLQKVWVFHIHFTWPVQRKFLADFHFSHRHGIMQWNASTTSAHLSLNIWFAQHCPPSRTSTKF